MVPDNTSNNHQTDSDSISLTYADRLFRYMMLLYLLVVLIGVPFLLISLTLVGLPLLGMLCFTLGIWPVLILVEEAFAASSIVLCIDSQQITVTRLLLKPRIVDLRDVRTIRLGKSRSRLHATLTVETQEKKLTTAVEYTLDLVEWARAVVAVGEEVGFSIVAKVDRPTWHPRPAGDRGTYTFVDSRSDK